MYSRAKVYRSFILREAEACQLCLEARICESFLPRFIWHFPALMNMKYVRITDRFDIGAGAYLVNVAVKQPCSHCKDPAVAARLWDETDLQIKAALAKY